MFGAQTCLEIRICTSILLRFNSGSRRSNDISAFVSAFACFPSQVLEGSVQRVQLITVRGKPAPNLDPWVALDLIAIEYFKLLTALQEIISLVEHSGLDFVREQKHINLIQA